MGLSSVREACWWGDTVTATKGSADQEAIHGVALGGFAAIKAALAEGHALADVLVVEGVSTRAWTRAEIAWKTRIIDDEVLFARFQKELCEAEDFLGGEVSPVGHDIAAWLSLLDSVAGCDASRLLDETGLTMNDLARLGRAWARRIKDDAKLEKRVGELRRNPLAPLGRIEKKSLDATSFEVRKIPCLAGRTIGFREAKGVRSS
jgi:hypothetical protein